MRYWPIGFRLYGSLAVILVASSVITVLAYMMHRFDIPADAKVAIISGLSGGLLLAGWITAWWLTCSFTRPLQAAVSVAKRVAAGDLTSKPKIVGKDEVSDLVNALASMNETLLATVANVRTSAISVVSVAEELRIGNKDLSSRTIEQAQSLRSTATTLDQLTSTVKANADLATKASELSSLSCGMAVEGGKVVNALTDTMGEINKSSKRIADIIGMIDSLAFQTNILALNAAVESARAGTHGRGFAVVASEVRVLAQRSAQASQEIRTLISESVECIESGSDLATQAGTTMARIVTASKTVSQLISEIASSSQGQSKGIEGTCMAVSQIDAITRKNTTLVMQAETMADTLREHAGYLSESVGAFRLECNADEAVAMVEDACGYLIQHGKGAALIAYSEPLPQFKMQDLYINAIDLQGNTLAHGENPKLIGRNLLGLKDADGKPFIKEFITIAKTQGSGWVDYRWPNPVTGIAEMKSTYVKIVDDLILGCGIYK